MEELVIVIISTPFLAFIFTLLLLLGFLQLTSSVGHAIFQDAECIYKSNMMLMVLTSY